MKIHNVTDPQFRPYGTVVTGYDFAPLVAAMQQKVIPAEGIDYVTDDPVLEALPIFRQFTNGFYGGMSVGLGYCMGHNQKLNALEYHRGSEVNVSATDYIVMVGKQQDIAPDGTYDSSLVELFYVPMGLAVEFYATTLHYCACHVRESGYAHATFLPKDTNCPIDKEFVAVTQEDQILFARNKWLLAHKDGGFAPNFPVRLIGENLTITPADWNFAL
ncbi:MAG: DUF4867 family protein [Faecousia sp.]